MSPDRTQLTAEQARRQLLASETRSLRSIGDRRVHAVGTALLGGSLTLYFSARNIATGTANVVATLLFVAVWLGTAFWVERATRTVPRRTKLWSRLGIGVSLVATLTAVLPWLNLQARTDPNTWPMVVGAALVAATPSLVAAVAIARSRS